MPLQLCGWQYSLAVVPGIINNSHPERNIWQWLNALVLACQEVIVVVFWFFFFFRELVLGFICASKSIQALAVFSVRARTETSNKLSWGLFILGSGSGTEEHRTNKEQSH